jgi:hypothetical protein
MKRRCNYCWELADKVTLIVAIERPSGPPFIKQACDECMEAQKLEPVE